MRFARAQAEWTLTLNSTLDREQEISHRIGPRMDPGHQVFESCETSSASVKPSTPFIELLLSLMENLTGSLFVDSLILSKKTCWKMALPKTRADCKRRGRREETINENKARLTNEGKGANN